MLKINYFHGTPFERGDRVVGTFQEAPRLLGADPTPLPERYFQDQSKAGGPISLPLSDGDIEGLLSPQRGQWRCKLWRKEGEDLLEEVKR